MSKILLSPNASGTGTFTIAAPNSNSDRTLTLPDSTGTVIVNSGAQTIEFADGSAGSPSVTNSGDTNTGMFFPAADTIAFAEGGVEAMRIDSSGNVGIGTATPDYRLVVQDATAATRLRVVNSGNGVAGSGIYMQVYNGASLVSDCTITSDNAGNLKFFTGTSSGSERMRIDSSGNLTINNSAPSTTAFGTKYYAGDANCYWGNFVNSTATKNQFTFNNPNGEVGRVTTNGSATTYNTSSDYRLKENVVPMTGALDTVSQLNPVNWTWKVDGTDGQGFIAHELQAIVPDCVTGEKDAVDEEGKPIYQGVDTSFLVATLTKAIQELKAIIDTQDKRIQELEGKA